MSQAGFTPIQLYYSTTAGLQPSASNMIVGELALNVTDKKLYARDNSGVFLLAQAGAVSLATNLAGGSLGSVPVQVAANTTSFLSPGTAGYVLQTNGPGVAPSWNPVVGYSGGTVTSVTGTGSANGLTLSGTVTGAGNITLGGAITGLSLTTQVSGTLPFANGGTNATTQQAAINSLTGTQTAGYYLRSDGTNASMSALLGTDISGTVPVEHGGTNIASYSIGDLLYASGSTTLAKLSDIEAGNVLLSGGVGAAPSYGKVNLTQHISGVLPIANGGTGNTGQQGAINALAGATTSGQYLRGNGTNVVMSAIEAGDVPTLNQNTTGTAAGLSATLAVSSGGTGATTQQAAIDALAGGVTSGYYLRGNDTNVVMSAIQAGDVPTLNQNTTGSAGSVATTNFTISQVGSKLVFKHGTTTIGSLDSSGNFIVTGNVTGYGTP
jgi:hypothetical protein